MRNIWFLSPLIPSKREKNIQTETIFVKVNIDGSMLKKYTNWEKLSCLSLYIFFSVWGKKRKQKPDIPHPRLMFCFVLNAKFITFAVVAVNWLLCCGSNHQPLDYKTNALAIPQCLWCKMVWTIVFMLKGTHVSDFW